MVKKYKILKVEEDVYQNIVRLKALRELEYGERFTTTDVLRELLESQPVFEITAKEV